MSASENGVRRILTREIALFTVLLFVGLVLLPISIWLVGERFFGEYGTLSAKIRAGNPVAWFLILAPYSAVCLLRLAAWGWRKAA